MREIKFRAWLDYSIIKSVDFVEKTQKYMEYDINISQDGKYMMLENWDYHGCIPEAIIMQFTGLYDNNSKEIWEHDILKHPDGTMFVVRYDEIVAGFRAYYKDCNYTTPGLSASIPLQIDEKGLAVVIGNIYENPELLKEINRGNND